MDLIETEDPSKVIDLNKRRHPKHGVRKRLPKGGAVTAPKYERILTEVLQQETKRQVAEATEEEVEFVDLFLNGTSPTYAFQLLFPERCIKLNKDSEPVLDKDGRPVMLSLEQIYDKADKLLNRVHIRALLRQKLEQRSEDIKHTSLILRNFVQQRLIHEAMNSTPAARIAALKELRASVEVEHADEEQKKKITSPDQVLDDIKRHLDALGA